MSNRWWVYQRERFPVFAHGALIAAFSFSAVAYSRMLRGESGFPSAHSLIVAFCTSFLFFLQLRIADEFKDAEEDARWRPYRPVPRGLVKLKELGVVFLMAGAAQLLLALTWQPKLALLLCGVWVYLAMMSKEFFVREWLKGRPITYMASHMIIMPLIDLYATSTDWMSALKNPPDGLIWFLLVSLFNGLVVEIGRKIRVPADEEQGVQTYSALWGPKTATIAWLCAMGLTTTFAAVSAYKIGFMWSVLGILGVFMSTAIVLSIRFLGKTEKGAGKAIENMAGIWTLAMYLTVGAFPLAWKLFGGGGR